MTFTPEAARVHLRVAMLLQAGGMRLLDWRGAAVLVATQNPKVTKGIRREYVESFARISLILAFFFENAQDDVVNETRLIIRRILIINSCYL